MLSITREKDIFWQVTLGKGYLRIDLPYFSIHADVTMNNKEGTNIKISDIIKKFKKKPNCTTCIQWESTNNSSGCGRHTAECKYIPINVWINHQKTRRLLVKAHRLLLKVNYQYEYIFRIGWYFLRKVEKFIMKEFNQ